MEGILAVSVQLFDIHIHGQTVSAPTGHHSLHGNNIRVIPTETDRDMIQTGCTTIRRIEIDPPELGSTINPTQA